MAVAAQVVACQVDQHHMLGIFLGIVAQVFGILLVLFGITRALGSAGNRVDERLVAFYAAMGLGGRTEDAETSEIEIEKIRAGIDATQGTIEFEVVALIFLDEASRDDNLKHITTQAMLDASADVGLVLLVGKW